MKRARLVIIVAVMIVILSLSGCVKKNYYFSFKAEQSLANSSGEWFPEGTTYEFTPHGLNLQYGNIACPLRFSGDFTVTVFFEANVDADHRYELGISLGDGTWYGTTLNDVHMEMYLGDDENESRYIYDHNEGEIDEYYHYTDSGRIPGIVRQGFNTYVIKKTGDNISIRINNVQYADFDLVYYDSEWFGPNLNTYAYDDIEEGYGITFYDIRVEYTGATSPMPLPEPEAVSLSVN
ncbi:MAG TPA: hypothetical protein PLI88_07045 [Bacillota bacterium]|nr:hypothetical protein [Bacillota bacterium]HOH09805.1 hypothetical protein [Bacillota bacterium]HOY88667.1 hypothetical protein [Bacillota bacterium]HPI01880.1 hypothetical protein [Bacillota bacterium]HPM63799.1 hypothetical protein [Bacillota bacterium]